MIDLFVDSPTIEVPPGVVQVTPDMLNDIRLILETACSDSRFVEKAFKAIIRLMAANPYVPESPGV